MTRTWTFSLTDLNKWYNLWDDLIARDPSFIDPSFANAPYVPSSVCELKYQNQSPGTVAMISDKKVQLGFQLTGGAWDVLRSMGNAISLKNFNFKIDTNPTVLYISVVAN